MGPTQADLTRTAGKPIHCKAAVARKPEPLVIEEVIVAPPKVHEVRLKIICTSLCHSDVTFCKLKDFPRCFARILEHEAFGVVESVGEDAHDLKGGDSVVLIFLSDCAQCIHCTSKKCNTCSTFEFKKRNKQVPTVNSDNSFGELQLCTYKCFEAISSGGESIIWKLNQWGETTIMDQRLLVDGITTETTVWTCKVQEQQVSIVLYCDDIP